MKHNNSNIILSLIICSLISLPVYAGGGKGAGKGGGVGLGGGENRQSIDFNKRGLDHANQQSQEIKQNRERKQIHQNDPGSGSEEMKQMRNREEKQVREKINQNDAGAQRNEMKQIRERNE